MCPNLYQKLTKLVLHSVGNETELVEPVVCGFNGPHLPR